VVSWKETKNVVGVNSTFITASNCFYQGCTNLKKNWDLPQDSSRQKGDLQPVPYWEPANIRHHRIKFVHPLVSWWMFYVKDIKVFRTPYVCNAGPNGRAVHGVGPRLLACWDCGFESHRRHGYVSVVSVVCCQRSLCDEMIGRPEESYRLWCVVMCDLGTSWNRRPWPSGGCCLPPPQMRVIVIEDLCLSLVMNSDKMRPLDCK